MAQPDCSSTSTTIQIVGQISSLITVIGGWFVVHGLTKKREKRKQVFEEVESFCNSLLALEKKSIKFHLNPSFDESLSGEISLDIQRNIARLNFYPLSSLNIDRKFLIDFRQSITLKNFVRSEFHQLDPFHPIIKEISFAIDEITNQLREEFIVKFGP